MVNIKYRTARLQGQTFRSAYRFMLPFLNNTSIKQERKLDIDVYAMCNERDIPEQIVCIKTFLQNIAIPNRFTIVSDGSISQKSISLLQKIHSSIEVKVYSDLIVYDTLPASIKTYISQHWGGKKIATLISLPINRHTIYTDSDILFFPNAYAMLESDLYANHSNKYLLDCDPMLDQRLIREPAELENPVNSGFFILKNKLNWDYALKRLQNIDKYTTAFTEQTVVHLAMHHNKAEALNPNAYIVNRNDEFYYADDYLNKNIVMRHYVTPIRHKFWNAISSVV